MLSVEHNTGIAYQPRLQTFRAVLIKYRAVNIFNGPRNIRRNNVSYV